MRVIGIETSCDDTGVGVYDAEQGLLAHKLASQVEIHRDYGGVVPELAARDHIRVLMPLITATLAEAGDPRIDGVAYTAGPGLMGALLVGVSLGRSLAFGWQLPAAGIHHMEGHLLSPMLEADKPDFPFIALLVSGGHSLLVDVLGIGCYEILGTTLDDAVGEAFDKTAKVLGLDYPGGPAIADAARSGRPNRYNFPRPMTNRPGLDFSFSGLKTHVRNTAERALLDSQTTADIAWSFQDAAIDTLVIKCTRALKQKGRRRLVVAGGVGANIELRKRLTRMGNDEMWTVYYPRPEFCTDNGAMIAYAGWVRLSSGQKDDLPFVARPRWSISDLPPIKRI